MEGVSGMGHACTTVASVQEVPLLAQHGADPQGPVIRFSSLGYACSTPPRGCRSLLHASRHSQTSQITKDLSPPPLPPPQAVQWYTIGLQRDEEKALHPVLLSNRSSAFAHVGNWLGSLEDANNCIAIRPTW